VKAAVTISLVAQAKGGPFVFWGDLAAGCTQAAALGFHAVEVFSPGANDIDRKLLRHLLDEHHLDLAAMGTGAGWVIHKWHLCHTDPEVRRHAREFVRAMIDLAGQFGAPAIIGSMQGRFEGAVSRDQALEWLSEALNDLGSQAARHQQPLFFEPLNRFETNLLNRVGDTVAFLETLKATNVKILADLFHMNIEEVSLAEALRSAGRFLGHVHFVDSNRWAAGFGHTEMGPIVKALRDIGYEGYLSAEILPLPDSDTAARQTMKSYKQLVNS